MVDNKTNELPELLENILKRLDFKTLRLSRLVNKFWNEEACRVLRAKSQVPLNEANKEEVEDFSKVFEKTKISDLPSPFKKLHLTIDHLGASLQNLLSHYPQVCIEHLYLGEFSPLADENFQNNLYTILETHGNSIEYFRCALHTNVQQGSLLSIGSKGNSNNSTGGGRSGLKLPALVDFGFWDWEATSKRSSLEFLCDVIQSAPNLTKLSPGSLDDRILFGILTQSKLEYIQELTLECATKFHFELLSAPSTAQHLAQLKSLWIDVYYENLEENRVKSETLQKLVYNFSRTLEDLSMTWLSNTPDNNFPLCPQLKSFSIWGWNGSLEIFNEQRLPSLKSIKLKSFPGGRGEGSEDEAGGLVNLDLNPHGGVESLILECSCEDEEENEEDQQQQLNRPDIDAEYVSLFEYVRDQYPRLNSIDLTLSTLPNEMVTALIRLFPQLQTLALDSESQLSENIFTGINMFTLQRCLNKGIPPESVKSTESLVQLKDLKTLSLGRYSSNGLLVSNNAVKFGLALIPCLRVLHLNWHPNISIDVVSTHLQHLNKLVINNSDIYIEDIMESLCERMPQTVLKSSEYFY